jgi:hypothetical protein
MLLTRRFGAAGQKWKYVSVIEGEWFFGSDRYCTYGLIGTKKIPNGWVWIESIHNVTINHEESIFLAELFTKHQFSPDCVRKFVKDILLDG